MSAEPTIQFGHTGGSLPLSGNANMQTPHPQTKRVALFGLFGCGNLGNDASLTAILDLLHRQIPDASITCICPAPEVVQRTHGVRALRLGLQDSDATPAGKLAKFLPTRLANLVRVMRCREFDLLIFPGTGILDDFGASPWTLPLSILVWCGAMRLHGGQVAFVSIGAGPIHHPLTRIFMKQAARLANYRSYRDVVSKDFMDSLGLDVRGDEVFPDLAFSLPTADQLDLPEGREPVVGLSLMSYYGWRHDREAGREIHRSYMRKMESFVRWLLSRGYRVRFLMSDQADKAAADELIAMLAARSPAPPAEALVADVAHSLHDVMRQVAETELVVATRFHSVVSALMHGKPVISIGYAKKNDALLSEMGMGKFTQNIEDLDPKLLIEQFLKLQSNRELYVPQIRETATLYREHLSRQERVLARLLLGLGEDVPLGGAIREGRFEPSR